MTKIILGTNTDMTPTIEIGQQGARYAWRWGLGAEGLQVIERPVRLVRGMPDPNGELVDPPEWARVLAEYVGDGLTLAHTMRRMNPTTLASLAEQLEVTYAAFAKGITHEPPGLRQNAIRWAASLHRRALAHGTPLQESEMLLQASAKLSDLLRRTDPRRAAKHDGPTHQTVDKHVPDPIETLLTGHLLTDQQKQAAGEARAIWRAITHKLDAKAGNMEAIGGGGGGFEAPFTQMSEAMKENYSKRYAPWSAAMAKRQWWYDPARRGMFAESECKYATSVTYWHILTAVLFEGMALTAADAKYRLPPGRAQIAVKVGLDSYGRAG